MGLYLSYYEVVQIHPINLVSWTYPFPMFHNSTIYENYIEVIKLYHLSITLTHQFIFKSHLNCLKYFSNRIHVFYLSCS